MGQALLAPFFYVFLFWSVPIFSREDMQSKVSGSHQK